MKRGLLASRRKELESRLKARGIDWKRRVGDLPSDDDGLMVAAMGSLLELDIRAIFDESMTLDEIEGRSRLQAEAANGGSGRKADDMAPGEDRRQQ